jgi:hypothetical protein
VSKNFIRAAVEGNEQGGKGGRRQAARWAWWRRTIFGFPGFLAQGKCLLHELKRGGVYQNRVMFFCEGVFCYIGGYCNNDVQT